MAESGPGELIAIEERLNSEQYIEILEEVMIQSVRSLLIPEDQPIYIAMDNSSVHNARIVRDWFSRHPDIIRIPWPPKSPDLNPIENLWAYMTHKWDAGSIKSKDNIISHAKQIWESLRPKRDIPNICESLVASMPKRLGNVINSRGSYTKY